MAMYHIFSLLLVTLTFVVDSEAASHDDTVFNILTANVDPRLVLIAEQLEANRVGYGLKNDTDLAANVFIQNTSDLASNVFIQNTSDLASNLFIQNTSGLASNVFIQNTSGLASNVFIQNSSDLMVILAEQLKADLFIHNSTGLASNVYIQNTSDLRSNVYIQNNSDLMAILTEQVDADLFIQNSSNSDHIRGQDWEGEEEADGFWIKNGDQSIYISDAVVFEPVMTGNEVDHYVMTECKNGKCLGDDGPTHIWSAPNSTVYGTLTKYRYLDADGVEQEESVDPHSVICKNGGKGVCIDYATKEGADLMATLIELTEQHGSDLVSILSEQMAADSDYGNEHIRGQDWEGEDERELIVSHGEIMPMMTTATNQWTPSFVVLVGVLTVFAVVMIWRAANSHKKWAKDDYVPISDESAKTSHMIYV